jgi:hypothetical protein
VNRTLRNVVAVVVLTAFTAIAVVATVQATDRIVGTDSATAAGVSSVQVADQDGSSDSGAQSSSQGYGNGSGGSSAAQSAGEQTQSTGPYGYDSSVYTPDENGLMYCPATGCAETSCHALQ